jgi:hypothetical protein
MGSIADGVIVEALVTFADFKSSRKGGAPAAGHDSQSPPTSIDFQLTRI